MIALLVAILMVVLPLVHLALSKVPRTPLRVIHILLLYALVLGVGVIGLPLGFVPHVFFPDKAAELIGWAPSPFQLEVGFHDGAWGILGFLCIWIGGLFWLATGLGWSFFMLGATYGHIRETVMRGDYAPYNFFTIDSSGFGCSCCFTSTTAKAVSRSKGLGGHFSGLPQGLVSPIYSSREVGSRRVPRQPGQVRKEAAPTRLTRVVRPASHLSRPVSV